MSVFHSYPGKALYTLLAIIFETIRFPFFLIKYAIPALRPHSSWTMRQAIAVHVVKRFLTHTSAIHIITPQALLPGREGKRFAVLKPADGKFFVGPTKVNPDVKPAEIGATWTKNPITPSIAKDKDVDVIVHFHGGAYVIGDGRDHDTGFLASTLIKHARVSHVVTPQYRLSSNAGGVFPAQLQDAITSYTHLLFNLGIPASRITLSGDSAGANLAIGLMRYISEYGSEVGLPWPAACLLWSPWINLVQAYDPANVAQSPQYHTDYIPPGFGHWGALTMTGGNAELMANSYLSPLNKPFKSKSPVFIQTGSAEVLYHDDVEIAEEFEKEGSKVELNVQEACPHDIILIGHLLGFERQARDAAKRAGEFMRENRLVEGSKL